MTEWLSAFPCCFLEKKYESMCIGNHDSRHKVNYNWCIDLHLIEISIMVRKSVIVLILSVLTTWVMWSAIRQGRFALHTTFMKLKINNTTMQIISVFFVLLPLALCQKLCKQIPGDPCACEYNEGRDVFTTQDIEPPTLWVGDKTDTGGSSSCDWQ